MSDSSYVVPGFCPTALHNLGHNTCWNGIGITLFSIPPGDILSHTTGSIEAGNVSM